MPAIWSSSMRPAPASAICAAPTRRRRSSASIRMPTRLPISSSSFCRGTIAGIRRNTCSAKATARRAPRRWPTSCENEKSLDLNGVILLSQILNFDDSADAPQFNPGVDLPYSLALPTYAATAWYHHKLPNQPAALEPFLHEVEAFAMGEYLQALAAGSTLAPAAQDGDRGQAARLHRPAGRLHRAREPARQRRRVREDAAGRGNHHRPLGHAVRGSDHRSDEQGGRLRSAVGGDFLRLCLGIQRLRADDAQIRRRRKSTRRSTSRSASDWDFMHQPPGSPSKVPAR